MKIVLLNPPHTAIGSRIPGEHLPPLGLLSIGGPLLDDDHDVRLVDADLKSLCIEKTVLEVIHNPPQIMMIGHSGSSSVHETVLEICRNIKEHLPQTTIIYGGVHPTYHWDEIMSESEDIDVIVKGEGERTAQLLVRALASGMALSEVAGIVFREGGTIKPTVAAEVISDLDLFRVGWELICHKDYSYWGGKRAVVVQFSRGCPYLCSYCGQRGFWTKWCHRDPIKFAQELARP